MNRVARVAIVLVPLALGPACRDRPKKVPPDAAPPVARRAAAPVVAPPVAPDAAGPCLLRVSLGKGRVELETNGASRPIAGVGLLEDAIAPLAGRTCSGTIVVAPEAASGDVLEVADVLRRAGVASVAIERAGAPVMADPTDEPADGMGIVVELRASGETKIEGIAVAPDKLSAAFARAFASDPGTKVVIAADPGVPHARVIALMDAAKQAGLTRLAISVRGGARP